LSIEVHLPLVTIITLTITLPLLENIHHMLEALEHTLAQAWVASEVEGRNPIPTAARRVRKFERGLQSPLKMWLRELRGRVYALKL
jgi:hypothetical protein